MLNADGVRSLIRLAVSKTDSGTASEWARSNNVSPAYVSDVLAGAREPGDKILNALGLERVVTYRRKTNGTQA